MEEYVSVDELNARLSALQDPVLQGKLTKALGVLGRALALYRPEQLALSFNGGKDSTVLLHLLRLAVAQHAQQQQQQQQQEDEQQQHRGAPPPLAAAAQANGVATNATSSSTSNPHSAAATRAAAAAAAAATPAAAAAAAAPAGLGGVRSFYFERADDFAAVRAFVRGTDAAYALGCEFLGDPDFNAGLRAYLGATRVAAVVLGTRRGDPNAEGQEYFCPSSPGWPPFMRVNPVLDWTYHDVWAFLRAVKVAYCPLYDAGYTSLGGVHNTLPNSALKRRDGSFAPAYLLADGRLERSGRATKQRAPDSLPASAAAVEPLASPRAGVVVVGDEILSGKVSDLNAPFLCRELRAIGWVVARVVAVPDDVAAIAKEVAAMSRGLDAVVTSGGVGPTLDDVTMAGVADAFGTALVRNPLVEESLVAYFGDNVTEAHLKMADTPEDHTTLLPHDGDDGRPSPFPVVRCKNVFVLPGVPHLLQRKWRAVRGALLALRPSEPPPPPFGNRVLRLSCADEAAVAPLLDKLAAEYGAEVAIGSYPVTEQPDGASLLLTLESKRTASLSPAAERLRGLLPAGALLSEARDVDTLVGGGGGGGDAGGGDAGGGDAGGCGCGGSGGVEPLLTP